MMSNNYIDKNYLLCYNISNYDYINYILGSIYLQNFFQKRGTLENEAVRKKNISFISHHAWRGT